MYVLQRTPQPTPSYPGCSLGTRVHCVQSGSLVVKMKSVILKLRDVV